MDPGDLVTDDLFGSSVALSSDGNTALVGAPYKSLDLEERSREGRAYVFSRSNGTWTLQQSLLQDDPAYRDQLGNALALSSDGNTALIGASGRNSNTGAAFVFTRSGANWSQQQALTSDQPHPGDFFGGSMDLSSAGNTALVAGGHQGAVIVFTRANNNFTQQTVLATSDGAIGSKVALSADGNRALIGAGTVNSFKGAAYFFTQSQASWSQQQKFTGNDTANNDRFGGAVDLSGDGNTALVGAISNQSVGGAYIFNFCAEPQVVTSTASDGSCGTLGLALAKASANPTDKAITITLAAGSIIPLTGGLSLTAGVSISTTAAGGSGAGGMEPPVILQGSGSNSGDGLTLAAKTHPTHYPSHYPNCR